MYPLAIIAGLFITFLSGLGLWKLLMMLQAGFTAVNFGAIAVAGILIYFLGALLIFAAIGGVAIAIWGVFE